MIVPTRTCMLLACLLLTALPAQAQDLETYQLVLFEKGPNRPADMPPGGDDIHRQHLAHFARLQAEGKVIVLGPFGGDQDARGVAILKAASADEARAVFADDPSVKAGRLVAKPMLHYSAPSNFKAAEAGGATDTLYFGFLVNGKDRSQDPDTAKTLQAGHLAYMTERHKEGKLLAAGPLGDGSEHRRGIIVYRAASMDEARALAEGDPAVKAGRLAVELYPWTVPRGVFR
jgi:uncharacterized protein YciI